jgi:membrane-bound lytic murein transglycosylase A
VAAGRIAGEIKDGGRMVVLLPIELAFRLVPGG